MFVYCKVPLFTFEPAHLEAIKNKQKVSDSAFKVTRIIQLDYLDKIYSSRGHIFSTYASSLRRGVHAIVMFLNTVWGGSKKAKKLRACQKCDGSEALWKSKYT